MYMYVQQVTISDYMKPHDSVQLSFVYIYGTCNYCMCTIHVYMYMYSVHVCALYNTCTFMYGVHVYTLVMWLFLRYMYMYMYVWCILFFSSVSFLCCIVCQFRESVVLSFDCEISLLILLSNNCNKPCSLYT